MAEANIEGNAGSASPGRQEPNHLRRALIIWVVLSVLGVVAVIMLLPNIFPASASDASNVNNLTLLVFTIMATPVAMFVFVFLGYSLAVFRVKERPTEDGVHLLPTPALQVGWLGITSALCLFLLIWGMIAFYQETSAAPTNKLVVQITGQQWMWTFYYPDYHVSSQGQSLVLPVDRPVEFDVTSKDVVHGFAIRALGVRVDANPGQVAITPIVTPNQIGEYTVTCVELCGLYHSYMWAHVEVVSQKDFDTWIANQGGHS